MNLDFTKTELIHMRRFLNRGVACSEGRCWSHKAAGWYHVDPILKKIANALESHKETNNERSPDH